MQAVLDLVWEHLLPAFDGPGDRTADEELAGRLAALAVPLPGSPASGPDQAAWPRSPRTARSRRRMPVRGWSAWTPEGVVLTLDAHGAAVPLRVGEGQWSESVLAVDGAEPPVVAAGGWTADGTFEADVRLIETPHTIRLRSSADGTADLGWRQVPLHGPDPLSLAVRGPALPAQT